MESAIKEKLSKLKKELYHCLTEGRKEGSKVAKELVPALLKEMPRFYRERASEVYSYNRDVVIIHTWVSILKFTESPSSPFRASSKTQESVSSSRNIGTHLDWHSQCSS